MKNIFFASHKINEEFMFLISH